MIRSFGHRLFLLLGVQSLCGQNLLFFQNPRNLLRSLAVDAHIKNHLDNGSRFLIQNPMLLVLRVTSVAIGRLTHVPATGTTLMQADTDFLTGVSWIPLVK